MGRSRTWKTERKLQKWLWKWRRIRFFFFFIIFQEKRLYYYSRLPCHGWLWCCRLKYRRYMCVRLNAYLYANHGIQYRANIKFIFECIGCRLVFFFSATTTPVRLLRGRAANNHLKFTTLTRVAAGEEIHTFTRTINHLLFVENRWKNNLIIT